MLVRKSGSRWYGYGLDRLMCEALVMVQDKQGFDPKANALSDRPGDVIVVCEDGWPWTKLELTNPNWCVLKMPGMPVAAFAAMVPPVLDAAGRMVAKHSMNFDLSNPAMAAVAAGKASAVTVSDGAQKTAILAAAVVKDVGQITVG